MSAANAAARKRRAAPDAAPSVVNRPAQFGGQSAQSTNPSGLTLPQVIAVIDNRLLKLEGFMKESSQNKPVQHQQSNNISKELEITNNDIVLQEIDQRFELLAEEVNNLKDMLLKLQTYTMEVNKMLMEERVRVFSDLGGSASDMNNITFSENVFQDNIEDSSETSTLDLRGLAESELNP
jgi:hypothetical protein